VRLPDAEPAVQVESGPGPRPSAGEGEEACEGAGPGAPVQTRRRLPQTVARSGLRRERGIRPVRVERLAREARRRDEAGDERAGVRPGRQPTDQGPEREAGCGDRAQARPGSASKSIGVAGWKCRSTASQIAFE